MSKCNSIEYSYFKKPCPEVSKLSTSGIRQVVLIGCIIYADD